MTSRREARPCQSEAFREDVAQMVTRREGHRWPRRLAMDGELPTVMTIQPAFCPLDRANRTFATTPSPGKIRIIVPIASAMYVSMRARD
jgi:hypothetical protein